MKLNDRLVGKMEREEKEREPKPTDWVSWIIGIGVVWLIWAEAQRIEREKAMLLYLIEQWPWGV